MNKFIKKKKWQWENSFNNKLQQLMRWISKEDDCEALIGWWLVMWLAMIGKSERVTVKEEGEGNKSGFDVLILL